MNFPISLTITYIIIPAAATNQTCQKV